MKDTLRKTKKIMNQYEIKANKRFGQNFLVDDAILERIIESADITKKDLVIEIGPGLGNLTEYILDSAKYALLIEIDKKMIEILNNRFLQKNNYMLLNEDILKIDIDKYIFKLEEEKNIKFDNIKVVANLPYYITTPIIFKLLQDESRINEIVVMVQKEVADRMVALPKTKDYGILTLMVEYLSDAKICFTVPKESFIPSPNVTSAIIKLKKNKKYTIENEKVLFDLIHSSFAKRRKKMINSLQMSDFLEMDKNSLEKLFSSCNIDLNVRAEELNLSQYIKISNKIL